MSKSNSLSVFIVLLSQLVHQEKSDMRSEIVSRPTVSQHTLSEGEDDGEGEAERRRELAEEGMAQAGQPQKLEEDLDQPQEEEEEEPEQEQPDENALDRQRRQPQLVRSVLNHPFLP